MGKNSILFTKREEELMEFLWTQEKPLTGNEILELCEKRTWSESYLHVMLRSLLEKGAIEPCGLVQYATQYARQFRCAITKEEYFVRLAKERGVHPCKFLREAIAFAAAGKKNEKVREKLEEALEELEHG